jgi:uncharacterized protein YecE (DUF72 family)
MGVLIGTSGWVYDDWSGRFYPKGLARRGWLSYYAEHFQTVEINGTFYRLPSVKAVAGWRSQVPEGFRFVVKGSRYITHMKRLTNLGDGLNRFFDRLVPLGSMLAVVLWQLPPTMKLDDERFDRLDHFLDALPSGPRHAVEFRDASWQCEDGYGLLDKHRALVVNVSGPQLRADTVVTGGCVYVRFHGLRSGYAYDYTDRDLRPWVAHLRGNDDGFAFFNNDVGGHAVKNAVQLRELLQQD